jgi:hypothetical protein
METTTVQVSQASQIKTRKRMSQEEWKIARLASALKLISSSSPLDISRIQSERLVNAEKTIYEARRIFNENEIKQLEERINVLKGNFTSPKIIATVKPPVHQPAPQEGLSILAMQDEVQKLLMKSPIKSAKIVRHLQNKDESMVASTCYSKIRLLRDQERWEDRITSPKNPKGKQKAIVLFSMGELQTIAESVYAENMK